MTLLEINHKLIEVPFYDAEAFRVLADQEPEMHVFAVLCDDADHGDVRKAMPRFFRKAFALGMAYSDMKATEALTHHK